jgi:signal transduction histidine kinase
VLRERLDQISHRLDETLHELREVAHGIHPPVLSEWGLVAALRRIRLHTAKLPRVQAHDIGRYPPEVESAIYYCCVEAVQNATKHGGADVQIEIRLRHDGGHVTFEVADDGPGFDAARAHGGTGLQNMQDRLGALGGRLTIESAVGQGTVVSGRIPVAGGGQAVSGEVGCGPLPT